MIFKENRMDTNRKGQIALDLLKQEIFSGGIQLNRSNPVAALTLAVRTADLEISLKEASEFAREIMLEINFANASSVEAGPATVKNILAHGRKQTRIKS